MKNFVLLGASGYIAVRHMRAIKATENRLVAAMDPHDAVGVIDSYFPQSAFFSEFERLDRHVEKLKRSEGEDRVDYVSIASPNYLHDAHTRFALRVGADAICEKPLVLEPWNLEALAQIEKEYGGKVNAILQLRLHPAIAALKQRIDSSKDVRRTKYDIDLTYITSRGVWYLHSWKGNLEKSGGIATNIGIHFFDMLQWVFGDVERNTVHLLEPTRAAGYLELRNARVRWFLSLNRNDIPRAAGGGESNTYRSISIGGEELEFSEGFTDLHTLSYKEILKGKGFGIEDVRPSIEIVHEIRNVGPMSLKGEFHPLAKGLSSDEVGSRR